MFKLRAFWGCPLSAHPRLLEPPPHPLPTLGLSPWPYIAAPSLPGSRASLGFSLALAGPESLAGGAPWQRPRLAMWEGAAEAAIQGKLEHWPLLLLLILRSEQAASRELEGSQACQGPSGVAGLALPSLTWSSWR